MSAAVCDCSLAAKLQSLKIRQIQKNQQHCMILVMRLQGERTPKPRSNNEQTVGQKLFLGGGDGGDGMGEKGEIEGLLVMSGEESRIEGSGVRSKGKSRNKKQKEL